MAAATYPAIIGMALSQHWVVVTSDADSHAVLAVTGPSVVRVRQQGLRATNRLLDRCTLTVKARKTTGRLLDGSI